MSFADIKAAKAAIRSTSQFISVMFEKKDGSATVRLIGNSIGHGVSQGGPDKMRNSPYMPFYSVNDGGFRALAPDAIIAISCGSKLKWVRDDAQEKATACGLSKGSKLYKMIFPEA